MPPNENHNGSACNDGRVVPTQDGSGPLLEWRGKVAHFRGRVVEHRLVEVAGMTLQIAAMKDAAELLDEPDFGKRFMENDIAPYGVELWPAAVMLAEYIAATDGGAGNRAATGPTRSAIELGCGLGLVSIVAAKLGWRVVASDHEQTALAFAAYNARLNDAPLDGLMPLDWHNPPTDRRFDCVLGADILYQLVDHRPILDCIRRLLTPGGMALIADPNRGVADRFAQTAGEAAYRVDLHPTGAVGPAGKLVDGRIFRLYRA